jgi:TnsA endonuclease N terminal
MEPIAGHRLSKVTFAATEWPIRLDNLRRVREPVSRSKSSIHGKVADVFGGRSRHAESQNELKAFRVLMATARSDAWQEQPFCLEYQHDGTQHRYTPDVLVAWGAHQEAVEIKEDPDAELPDNQSRFALIRELLAEHGIGFRLWKKSEICAEPRLANAALILRYRTVEVSAREHEGIRRTFSLAPELPLRTFSQNPQRVQSVLRLVLDGTLHIDWWQPLGLDATISTAPIGRLVWPFPPSDSQEVICRCMH